MAKTYRQILDEMGKIPPEKTMKDYQEMLDEKDMTDTQFSTSKEYLEEAKRSMAYRFSSPDIFKKK